MKRVLAVALLAAGLAGCSTDLFRSVVPNTLPGTPAAAPAAPAATAAVTPVSTAALPAPASATAPARFDPRDQSLLDADRGLASAVVDQGLGAGLAELIEADATVLTPGGIFVGADQIRAGLKPGPTAGQLFWLPEKASTSASGDYGSTAGRYVQVLRGAEAVQGRYVSVWRKDSAGRWRIASTTAMPIRVAAPPAAAPAVEPKPAPRPAARPAASRSARR